MQLRLGVLIAACALVEGTPGLVRGPESCSICTDLANKADALSKNATSMAEAIAALHSVCGQVFNGTHALVCDLIATAAVDLLPKIEKGLDTIAWDSHATCAALGACSVPCCDHPTAPEQRHLSLSRRPSEMVVMWTTLQTTATHTVQWGLNASLGSSASGSASTYGWFGWVGSLHKATMTGLSPATTYYYRVGDAAGGWSPVASFKTLGADVGGATPLRVAVVADMGWGRNSNNTIARLSQLARDGKIDMMVHPGDIGYADGNMAGWDTFMREIEPIASTVPYMVSPGNHEFWFDFAAYKHRFAMADDGEHKAMYYSLDVGAVHLLSVSTESMLDKSYVSDKQKRWIEADLAAAQSANTSWRVVYGHRPLYCGQTHGSDIPRGPKYLRKRLEATYIGAGVDLVLQGHVHDYQRTYPVANGVPTSTNYSRPSAPVYVVNGAAGNRERNDRSGGGFPWEPPANPATGEVPYSSAISFGVVTLRTGSLLWEQFFSVNGTRFDHFSITK
jgi:predicted MPP superfamily phosphohydrolase